MLEQEFQLVLHQAEHVMHKEETLHLEHQDSHSTWLHTVAVQLKVTDNRETAVQEQIILQELVQVAVAKVTGFSLGVAEAVAEALEALENTDTLCLTLEDTQDTLAELELLQKDHHLVVQDGITVTTLEDTLSVDVAEQDYTALLVAVAVQDVAQVVEVQMVAVKDTEIM
jgi:hypothetical protein